MSKMKDLIDIFGTFTNRVIASDVENLKEGEIITLVNSNCEFEYDSVLGCFNNNLYYYYIVDLEPVDVDLSNYKLEKSNNGGAYGFCTCRVAKVHKKTY